jgi:hypothetical protein
MVSQGLFIYSKNILLRAFMLRVKKLIAVPVQTVTREKMLADWRIHTMPSLVDIVEYQSVVLFSLLSCLMVYITLQDGSSEVSLGKEEVRQPQRWDLIFNCRGSK